MMKVRPGLAVIPLFFMLMTPAFAASSVVTESASANPTWTIMVYMADDYPVVLSWQDDINEMEAAQQAPGTNIIALVDQYGVGDSFILKVAHDPNFLNDTIVSQQIDDAGAVITGGEVDMASSTTLSSFIEFCAGNYPADKLVLILWGHGASWRGLCPDGVDLLTLPKLSSGLSDAKTAIGRGLDMIVVDSCAEASVEMFAQLRGYTTLFVGSEKDVPYQGLPYVLVLNDLAAEPAQGISRFGSHIADDYVAWSSTNSDYSVTMGVFNITKTDALLADMGALSRAGTRYDQLFHTSMRAALDASEQYEETFRVDFGDFLLRISDSDLPVEIRHSALLCLLDAERLVEHFGKYSNPYATDGILVNNATGMTIYPASDAPVDGAYADLGLAATLWQDFGRQLRSSTLTVANGPGPTLFRSSSIVYATSAYLQPLYPQPPVDVAYLTWHESHDRVQAVVYRNVHQGLVEVATYESSGDRIELKDLGTLTVAASAYLNDQAVSYVELNFTLEGSTTIGVRLLKGDKSVENVHEEYKSTFTKENGVTLEREIISSYNADSFVCWIKVPSEAEFGDVVTVEIQGKSSGDVVGKAVVTVANDSASVTIAIPDPGNGYGRIVVMTMFIALPAVLVLAFALMLYRQRRKPE